MPDESNGSSLPAPTSLTPRIAAAKALTVYPVDVRKVSLPQKHLLVCPVCKTTKFALRVNLTPDGQAPCADADGVFLLASCAGCGEQQQFVLPLAAE